MEGANTVDQRAQLHGMWSSVAGGWAEHADFVDARTAGLTERMVAGASPGERVLELACGPGGLGMAAAERVGPEGRVVLSDVAPEMAEIAAGRAAARGLANASTAVLDLEQIDQADGAYDAVLCREGLMFAADPARAAAEIRRVLRPGGWLAVAVWGPRERNPWLGVVLDTVSGHLGVELPPPGVPGPFSLSDPARLAQLLSAAGFEDVAIEEVSIPLRAPSFEDWWTRTSALAGPLAKVLGAFPQETQDALRERARDAVRPYETADGLDFPGVTLLATARA